MPALVERPHGASDGTSKKPKLSKNQMRRAKRKESRTRERESRDGSVVTDSEHEGQREEEASLCSDLNLS